MKDGVSSFLEIRGIKIVKMELKFGNRIDKARIFVLLKHCAPSIIKLKRSCIL